MTVPAKDWRGIIRWLAEKHHGGHYYPMAKRIGVSNATGDQWKHGVIRTPGLDSILKVCDAYGLDFAEVTRLLARTRVGPGA